MKATVNPMWRSSVTGTLELGQQVADSGLGLNELIRRGLAVPDLLALLEPGTLKALIREAVAEELDARGLTGKDGQR